MKILPLALGLGTLAAIILGSRRALASDGWGNLWIEPETPDPQSPNPDPVIPFSNRPRDYITSSERDARFGPLVYVHAPTASNPEAVTIVNDFESRLVRRSYPELPGSPTIRIHEEAAQPLANVLRDLAEVGELGLIRTFEGVWNPRLVRGGSTLSSHAYGTSIDVNAGENPLGGMPTADQKRLAEFFEARGWYWGERFSRPDPMHFEWIGGR